MSHRCCLCALKTLVYHLPVYICKMRVKRIRKDRECNVFCTSLARGNRVVQEIMLWYFETARQHGKISHAQWRRRRRRWCRCRRVLAVSSRQHFHRSRTNVQMYSAPDNRPTNIIRESLKNQTIAFTIALASYESFGVFLPLRTLQL